MITTNLCPKRQSSAWNFEVLISRGTLTRYSRISNHETASGYLAETSELNRNDQKPSIVFELISPNYFSFLQLSLCKSLNEFIFKLRFIRKYVITFKFSKVFWRGFFVSF